MFAWKTTAFEATTGSNALPTLDAHTSGMVAGTKVATGNGWASVETITAGQQVLTFDGGMQTVFAVTRHLLGSDAQDVASRPMSVPAGALGNLKAMTLLPHQSVLIESDSAEHLTGDPFALIPAACLEGFRGISQTRQTGWVEVIQLHFAQDEIVFANIGALFLCRAQSDLFSDTSASPYSVLPAEQADTFVGGLMVEDECRVPAQGDQYAVH